MAVKQGYKQTEVGVIPDDWSTVLLDSIANRGSGHTPNKKIKAYWNGEIKWISLKDSDRLDKRFVFDTCDKVTCEGIANSSAVLHPAGTVVLSRDAGVGKSAIMSDSMAVSQHFIAWYCGNTLHNLFLYYWLQLNKKEFERIAIGNTIKTIGLGYFRNLRIPYPNIAEQVAIAEALSDADALIESIEQLITKKRQIKQGAMQELLNPKEGWEKVKLGRLGVFLKGSGVKKDESMSGNIPCIRYGEIYTKHKNYIKAFDSWISPAVAATAKRIKSGDILFAGSGETKEEIGKCVAFVDDIEAYAGGDIVILRPNNANSLFLGCYLNTESVNRQKASKGQGDAVVHIGSNALADIDLIIPPVDEQAFIASVLFDMDAEIGALEAKLEKALQLKQGMMHNLLTGKIRLA